MYLEVKKNIKGYTHLQVETNYTKGGYNWYNGGTIERGYYISVCPVEKTDSMIKQALGEGYKQYIKYANRLSRKTLAELDANTLDNAKELITAVCDKYGLEVKGA